MNPALARYTIDHVLRGLSTRAADRKLCAMHSESLHAIAAVLGQRLPTVGGDKPALVGGALLAKGYTHRAR